MAPLHDDVMVVVEMLAAHDKMIDAVQVTAVLQRLGISTDVDSVSGVLNAFAAEQPPRLVRSMRVIGDGPGELVFSFELPEANDDDHA